jgi:hypothetical protein
VFGRKAASNPDVLACVMDKRAPATERFGIETGAMASRLWHEHKSVGLPVVCVAAPPRPRRAVRASPADKRVHEEATAGEEPATSECAGRGRGDRVGGPPHHRWPDTVPISPDCRAYLGLHRDGTGWASRNYEPHFVEGDDPATVHRALDGGMPNQPVWPLIALRTPKGWTGPKVVDGLSATGSARPPFSAAI